MGSETTAAAGGEVGKVRRDPMAMLPFCGYHMGDYLRHWLTMTERLEQLPAVFSVNWFRKNRAGEWLWPGFGQNIRVLEWMIHRCRGRVGAIDSAIGLLPRPEDVNLSGLELSDADYAELMAIDPADWQAEVESQRNFFAQFGERLPHELACQLDLLASRLAL
jgi:phosphoenolpyruvate carboxykinase (GTP)